MTGAPEPAQVKPPRRKPGRVPTSCAECRRLKLRCDRNVPCEKCVSRGCGSICPDGCLTPGKGNRLVLANTEELHERIDKLCSRIRELEEALRALQATVSTAPHPLLVNDLLAVKCSPQLQANCTSTSPAPSHSSSTQHQHPSPSGSATMTSASPSASTSATSPAGVSKRVTGATIPGSSNSGDQRAEVEDENLIDAFGMDENTLTLVSNTYVSLGTLTIGSRGEINFLGQTARSEYLIRASSKRPPPHIIAPPGRLSVELTNASCPEMDIGISAHLIQEVLSRVPPQAEAQRLCNVYLDYGRFLFTPMHRKELQEEVLDVVYKPGLHDSLQVHHALSLLFAILAIAILFDPNRPPYSEDAHEYFLLSRAAMNLSPPSIHTTLNAILTLMHLGQYLDLRDWESIGSNQAWLYVGFAFRLAYGVGLHLNSSRWHLCDAASERRSRVFWQLFSLDTWMSFSFGRPPSSFIGYIDCEFPKDLEEVDNSKGVLEMGFHPWCYRYTALLHSVIVTAFVPKIPPYATILKLDKQIRDFPVPSHLHPKCRVVNQIESPMFDVQRWFVLIAKETVLLNLHRGYFAQALQEQPTDLLKHRFGPSMLATYRSAWRIIETVVISWKDNPLVMSRVAMAWSQTLSAAIVMCLLATRAPLSNLTSSALEELDRALAAYEEAAATCRSASSNLDAMRNLRNKAYATVNRTHAHPHEPPSSLTPEELDRLGGKTRLIAPQITECSTTTSSPSPSSYTAASLATSATLPENNMELLFAGANMHPTIAQDLRNLDSGVLPLNELMDYPPIGVGGGAGGSSGGVGGGAFSDGIEQLHSMQDVQFLETLNFFGGTIGGGMGGLNGILGGGVSGSGGGANGVPGLSGYGEGYPMQAYTPPSGPSFGSQPAMEAVWANLVEHLGF